MGRKRLYTDEQRKERKKEAGMNHYHKDIERSREKRRHAARRLRAKKKQQKSILEAVVASNESRHIAGTHGRSKRFSQVEDRPKSKANRERMNSKSGNLGSKQDLSQSRARVENTINMQKARVEKAVLPPRLLNYPRIDLTNRSGGKDQANIEARREVESGLTIEFHHRRFATQSQGTIQQPEQLARDLPAHSYFMGERLPPSSPPTESDSDDDSISANWTARLRMGMSGRYDSNVGPQPSKRD
ncbi:hypothetical protein H0H93_013606 [Arthromyces matolae]|nr:hypothetical protein H0H93_013606 [Arthromyces matolae]